LKSICVFAGSSGGTHPNYATHAKSLGANIARAGLTLIYGGSKFGLMGDVASSALAHGAKVVGVMPTGLFRGELVHQGLTELVEVKDMHERKAKMGELSDAYIALPGGFGTFEELFEVISWAQLGIHQKPIGLLNVEGYYSPLIELVNHAVRAGFVQETHKALFVSAEDSQTLVQKLQDDERPHFEKKWTQ